MMHISAYAFVYQLSVLVGLAAGQGYRLSGRNPVGATGSLQWLQQQYKVSQNWTRSYKFSPKLACSLGSRGNLCGAAVTDSLDAYAQLTLATSPQVYSSLDPSYTNGVQLVNPSGDQQNCQTCSAFAVASAAETAMASALDVSASDCSISVQALYFCPEGTPSRACGAGWNLSDALATLQQQGQHLPTAACQPYKPLYKEEYPNNALCAAVCSEASRYASQGNFRASQFGTMWEAQRHIRQFGSVITGFDVYSDFKPFFANKTNAKAVYRPGHNMTPLFGHAVVLVGYDNVNEFWLAKNSWGTSWADGGYFRVAYDVCSVLTNGAEGAWGVLWTPNDVPVTNRLLVKPAPKPIAIGTRHGVGITCPRWLSRQVLQ